jgi:hypothetical protein
VDVGVGQIVVAAATTDDDRVVERGATAIGAPARQVSHCGVGVVVDGAGVSRTGPAWENRRGEQDACKPSVSIVKATMNHPFVIPPSSSLSAHRRLSCCMGVMTLWAPSGYVVNGHKVDTKVDTARQKLKTLILQLSSDAAIL